MKKPNIIFLMTDQQRWDCIGRFNSRIKTPNIDMLAENGITYNQAVCAYPACVPSRNAMMLGLYPSQLGVRSNFGGLFDENKLPTKPLPEILNMEGYQTAGFGKTHWNHGVLNDEPPTRGFETRVIGQHRDSSLYEHGAYMMSEGNAEGLKNYYEETKDYGDGEENIYGYIGCKSKIPNRDHRDGWVAEQCLEFLDNNELNPDKPLFLYLSFLKPHAGFNVPKEFEDLYKLEDIPDIPQPPWSEGEEPQSHIYGLNKGYEQWRDKWRTLTPEERKMTTLRYWANCSWLDSYFGEVLSRLEKMGRLENSIIVFTSDHGEMLGERNYIFRKYCLYDSSVRVPLILSGSMISKEKKGTVDERPAGLIDIVPTLTAAAGIKQNPILPGFDLLKDRKPVGNFSEFHGITDNGLQSAPAYMWRKKDWKIILYLDGVLKDAIERVDTAKGELYNLENDPYEWNNLYEDKEFMHIREQMKTELLLYMASVWSRGPFYYDEDGYSKLGCDEI